MASVSTRPSRAMRPASHAGTNPPWRGRSALPVYVLMPGVYVKRATRGAGRSAERYRPLAPNVVPIQTFEPRTPFGIPARRVLSCKLINQFGVFLEVQQCPLALAPL